MTDFYLYQIIHICEGQARFAKGHIAVMQEAVNRLYARPRKLPTQQWIKRLTQTIEQINAPHDTSSFIRMELHPNFELRLVDMGVSLYKGYDLRSIHPNAQTLVYELPEGQISSSAQQLTVELADLVAQREGYDVALQCDRYGQCQSCAGSPIMALKHNRIIAPPHPQHIERFIAMSAIKSLGMDYEERNFREDEIPSFEELFWIDHRGITSLAHCNGVPFLSFAAERIAHKMEELFCSAHPLKRK